jgi:hypothetical protein
MVHPGAVKAIRHRSFSLFHLKEDTMKKRGLLIISVLLFGGLISGCGDSGDNLKDAIDVKFTMVFSHVYTIDTNLTTSSYDLDLNTNENYQKYHGKIRDIEIDYLRYSITSNTGNGGKADFYANVYGGSFATATKVAGPINFAAGELRGVSDVVWLNKDYFEGLLISGKLSVWAVAEGTNVRLTVPTDLQLKVTANPLE